MANLGLRLIFVALALGSSVGRAEDTASLFESYFTSAKSQVPFPISELRRAVAGPAEAEVSANTFVFVPTGRSIQRVSTDLCHPRVITAVESPNGSTFLGYSEKAQTVEVISWNPGRERFEFLTMDNYAPGRSPRLVRADRALCLSCHQNGGPLFARAPWREINNPFQMKKFYETCLSDEKTEMIRGAYKVYQGIKVYESFGGGRSDDPAVSNGTSCLLPGLNPGCAIDNAVRASEQLLQETQACRSLCTEGDQACLDELKRLQIPKSAFSPLNDLDHEILARLKSQALPSSVLPDRNPNLNEANVFLLKNGSPTDLNLEVIDGDVLTRGEDAKWARPEERRLSTLEFRGFNFMALDKLSAIDQAGALAGLVGVCVKKEPRALRPDSEFGTPSRPAEGGPALFGFYCGKCHGESSNVHLPLNDLSLLRKVRNDWDASAEDLLRSHEMPRTAPGVPPLSDGDRAILIQMLVNANPGV